MAIDGKHDGFWRLCFHRKLHVTNIHLIICKRSASVLVFSSWHISSTKTPILKPNFQVLISENVRYIRSINPNWCPFFAKFNPGCTTHNDLARTEVGQDVENPKLTLLGPCVPLRQSRIPSQTWNSARKHPKIVSIRQCLRLKLFFNAWFSLFCWSKPILWNLTPHSHAQSRRFCWQTNRIFVG